MKDILNIIFLICSFFAVIFLWFEKFQIPESKRVRNILERYWEQLRLDHWLYLPERSIHWFLHVASFHWESIFPSLMFGGYLPIITLMMAPIAIHIVRFPIFVKTYFPYFIYSCIILFFLKLLLLSQFYTKVIDTSKTLNKVIKFIDIILNIGILALLIYYGLKYIPINFLVTNKIVDWMWFVFFITLTICTFIYLVALLSNLIKLAKLKDKCESIIYLSLSLPIALSWALIIIGFIDLSRWYAVSVSFIFKNAIAGGILRFYLVFMVLIYGIHLIALSLFNFIPPLNALIRILVRPQNPNIVKYLLERFFILYSLSVFFTAFSMGLGSYLVPSSAAALSVQLMLVNFICDMLVIFSIVWFFRFVVEHKKAIFFQSIVLLLNIIIAAALSITSLYFGVLGSGTDFTIQQVLNIFVGKDPQFSSVTMLDGYFFVMHTTFIPFAFYTIILVILWWGKIVLLFSRFLFIPKTDTSRPYALLRVSFLLLAAGTALVRVILECL